MNRAWAGKMYCVVLPLLPRAPGIGSGPGGGGSMDQLSHGAQAPSFETLPLLDVVEGK